MAQVTVLTTVIGDLLSKSQMFISRLCSTTPAVH